jgi:anaerobic selenocysteine-containing dehydrogenase
VIGQNPATNHPRMMAALHDAARRGAKVVAINRCASAASPIFPTPRRWVRC